MKTIDWITYIKLFLGLTLVFPIEWMFWSLDFGTKKGLLIALVNHLFGFILCVLMINYLEEESCFKILKKIKE